jgi:hypothetical protein
VHSSKVLRTNPDLHHGLLGDIPLEGYLKDEGPVDTSWVSHISGSQDASARSRVIVSLLREGEISSAEFMKLLYDDVLLRALENREEYEVSLSPKGEQALDNYLLMIAEKSLTPQQGAVLKQLDHQLSSLPKKSAAAEKIRKKVLDTILDADPWAKEKYELLNDPGKSQMLSGEDMLSLAQEIERRARRASVQLSDEDKAAMREYVAFWQGRLAASRTMVDGISGVARERQVATIAAPIGAFHTEGMSKMLQQRGIPFAVLRPLAMENPRTAGALGKGFENKYERKSVFDSGSAKLFMNAFPLSSRTQKKPRLVLETEWFQAKSETYFLTDRIVHQLLSGGGGPQSLGDDKTAQDRGTGAPPSGPPGGSGTYWGFSDDDLRGKRVWVDRRRMRIVPAAPGSKRQAVLFPLVLNSDNAATRKELWVKAALTREADTRETAENLLRDALREIEAEPRGERPHAEDAHGRVQISEDVHAIISATRNGALSVALGM